MSHKGPRPPNTEEQLKGLTKEKEDKKYNTSIGKAAQKLGEYTNLEDAQSDADHIEQLLLNLTVALLGITDIFAGVAKPLTSAAINSVGGSDAIKSMLGVDFVKESFQNKIDTFKNVIDLLKEKISTNDSTPSEVVKLQSELSEIQSQKSQLESKINGLSTDSPAQEKENLIKALKILEKMEESKLKELKSYEESDKSKIQALEEPSIPSDAQARKSDSSINSPVQLYLNVMEKLFSISNLLVDVAQNAISKNNTKDSIDSVRPSFKAEMTQFMGDLKENVKRLDEEQVTNIVDRFTLLVERMLLKRDKMSKNNNEEETKRQSIAKTQEIPSEPSVENKKEQKTNVVSNESSKLSTAKEAPSLESASLSAKSEEEKENKKYNTSLGKAAQKLSEYTDLEGAQSDADHIEQLILNSMVAILGIADIFAGVAKPLTSAAINSVGGSDAIKSMLGVDFVKESFQNKIDHFKNVVDLLKEKISNSVTNKSDEDKSQADEGVSVPSEAQAKKDDSFINSPGQLYLNVMEKLFSISDLLIDVAQNAIAKNNTKDSIDSVRPSFKAEMTQFMGDLKENVKRLDEEQVTNIVDRFTLLVERMLLNRDKISKNNDEEETKRQNSEKNIEIQKEFLPENKRQEQQHTKENEKALNQQVTHIRIEPTAINNMESSSENNNDLNSEQEILQMNSQMENNLEENFKLNDELERKEQDNKQEEQKNQQDIHDNLTQEQSVSQEDLKSENKNKLSEDNEKEQVNEQKQNEANQEEKNNENLNQEENDTYVSQINSDSGGGSNKKDDFVDDQDENKKKEIDKQKKEQAQEQENKKHHDDFDLENRDRDNMHSERSLNQEGGIPAKNIDASENTLTLEEAIENFSEKAKDITNELVSSFNKEKKSDNDKVNKEDGSRDGRLEKDAGRAEIQDSDESSDKSILGKIGKLAEGAKRTLGDFADGVSGAGGGGNDDLEKAIIDLGDNINGALKDVFSLLEKDKESNNEKDDPEKNANRLSSFLEVRDKLSDTMSSFSLKDSISEAKSMFSSRSPSPSNSSDVSNEEPESASTDNNFLSKLKIPAELEEISLGNVGNKLKEMMNNVGERENPLQSMQSTLQEMLDVVNDLRSTFSEKNIGNLNNKKDKESTSNVDANEPEQQKTIVEEFKQKIFDMLLELYFSVKESKEKELEEEARRVEQEERDEKERKEAKDQEELEGRDTSRESDETLGDEPEPTSELEKEKELSLESEEVSNDLDSKDISGKDKSDDLAQSLDSSSDEPESAFDSETEGLNLGAEGESGSLDSMDTSSMSAEGISSDSIGDSAELASGGEMPTGDVSDVSSAVPDVPDSTDSDEPSPQQDEDSDLGTEILQQSGDDDTADSDDDAELSEAIDESAKAALEVIQKVLDAIEKMIKEAIMLAMMAIAAVATAGIGDVAIGGAEMATEAAPEAAEAAPEAAEVGGGEEVEGPSDTSEDEDMDLDQKESKSKKKGDDSGGDDTEDAIQEAAEAIMKVLKEIMEMIKKMIMMMIMLAIIAIVTVVTAGVGAVAAPAAGAGMEAGAAGAGAGAEAGAGASAGASAGAEAGTSAGAEAGTSGVETSQVSTDASADTMDGSGEEEVEEEKDDNKQEKKKKDKKDDKSKGDGPRSKDELAQAIKELFEAAFDIAVSAQSGLGGGGGDIFAKAATFLPSGGPGASGTPDPKALLKQGVELVENPADVAKKGMGMAMKLKP